MLAALLAPPAAAAEPGYFVSPPQKLVIAFGKAGDWQLGLFGFGGSNISLALTRGDTGASYSTKGYFDGRRIRARFGRLGRVSMRFVRIKKLNEGAEQGDGCRGREAEMSLGHLVGSLRFRGERGYAKADLDRILAITQKSFRSVCRFPKGLLQPPAAGDEPKYESTELAALRGRPGRRLLFRFSKEKGGFGKGVFSLGFVNAELTEKRGALRISRSASIPAESVAGLLFDPDSESVKATLSPGPPFHGSAAFEGGQGEKPTWTGPLSVDLPGAGEIRLAGPGFRTALCRSNSLRDSGRCQRRHPELFAYPQFSFATAILGFQSARLAQPSASQSQLFSPPTRLSWSM